MAEPKVGMKFSSYLNMSKAYNKKSAKAKIEGYDRQVDSNPYNKIQVFNTTYFNKNGESIAHSKLETSRETQKSEFVTDNYLYRGEGTVYDSDIKYNQIYGNKTHAIDLNNNGIVDNGEIFKN